MEQVVRLADADAVAQRVASDLVELLTRVQSEGRIPRLVLTGGTVARKVHADVAAAASGTGVDWSRVDLWWGDGAFVRPRTRIATPARPGRTCSSTCRSIPSGCTRCRPPTTSTPRPADAAAWAYGQDLREAVGSNLDASWFDLVMLGIGPDGHCASLFPGRSEVESDADVLGVHDSPKPPPTRISLGMRTLRRADVVWFVATGEEKADAVSRSVRGGDVMDTRVGRTVGPHGDDVVRRRRRRRGTLTDTEDERGLTNRAWSR